MDGIDYQHHQISSGFAGSQAIPLIGWLAFCLVASGTAVFVSTSGWYAELNKPMWNPPGWIFGPVWTLLYVMMGIAAWLVWRDGGWKMQGTPLRLFLLQWLFNALWTPLFFGAHRIELAFVDIVLLWLTLVVTLTLFWRVNWTAGMLLIPYLGWVSFAAALNLTILRLNP
jgi:tryptophan-rich sensory protein